METSNDVDLYRLNNTHPTVEGRLGEALIKQFSSLSIENVANINCENVRDPTTPHARRGAASGLEQRLMRGYSECVRMYQSGAQSTRSLSDAQLNDAYRDLIQYCHGSSDPILTHPSNHPGSHPHSLEVRPKMQRLSPADQGPSSVPAMGNYDELCNIVNNNNYDHSSIVPCNSEFQPGPSNEATTHNLPTAHAARNPVRDLPSVRGGSLGVRHRSEGPPARTAPVVQIEHPLPLHGARHFQPVDFATRPELRQSGPPRRRSADEPPTSNNSIFHQETTDSTFVANCQMDPSTGLPWTSGVDSVDSRISGPIATRTRAQASTHLTLHAGGGITLHTTFY